jgi:hypothetical protein
LLYCRLVQCLVSVVQGMVQSVVQSMVQSMVFASTKFVYPGPVLYSDIYCAVKYYRQV